MSDRAASRGLDGGPRIVAVTGATGFLGTSLVRALLAGGHSVRMLVRSLERARELQEAGAIPVKGDITDRRALERTLEGAGVVYHLAGRLFLPGVDPAEYERIHVKGTRSVLAVCAHAVDLQRLVHCSTTGVLGVTGERPAAETAPLRPTNAYEATKARAEIEVRRAMRTGLPAVIARPGLVYGPGDLHLLSFFKAVLRRHFRPIGRRPVWLHPIYIDDMSEALLRCGEVPQAAGECFHLAGRHPVQLGDLAAAIARVAGIRPAGGHIPLPGAKLAARAGDHMPGRLRQAAPLTSSRLDFLTHSRVYDVTKAQRELGFSAPTELSVGVARTLAWYEQQGYVAREAA